MSIRNSTAPTAHSHKPVRRKPAPKAPHRRPAAKLPDLAAILRALLDALAVISVAHKAIAQNDHCDAEETVLQIGLDALEVIYDQLDAAAVQIARFQQKNAKVRGAS